MGDIQEEMFKRSAWADKLDATSWTWAQGQLKDRDKKRKERRAEREKEDERTVEEDLGEDTPLTLPSAHHFGSKCTGCDIILDLNVQGAISFWI